jgi:hypothetical protein
MKETEIENNRFYRIGNERRWKKSNAATVRIQDGKPVPRSARPASPNIEVDHIEPN